MNKALLIPIRIRIVKEERRSAPWAVLFKNPQQYLYLRYIEKRYNQKIKMVLMATIAMEIIGNYWKGGTNA